MASKSRRDSASLKELLLERTGRFEFLQVVRLFRKIWSDRAPVGIDSDPRGEVVRFRSDISSAFAASDVRDAVAPEDDARGELTVSFLGVATPGVFGALPRRYSEELSYQARNKNRAPIDFLDVFNHRLISLFYRAAEKSHVALAYDSGRHNAFERALYSVLGLGTEGLRGRLALDDRMLLARGGLLSMRPMPATALAGVIRSLFHQRVEIEQFVPGRYAIDPDDQNRLGRANVRLGQDFYMGGEVVLMQSKFRVRLGPLPREAYDRFLPDRSDFHALIDVIRFSVESGLDFDVQLLLQAEDVPALVLGAPAEGGPRLGYTSWLTTEAFHKPADDARFSPESAVPAQAEAA